MTKLSKVASVGFSAVVAMIGCGGGSSGATDGESALTSAAADINALVASDDAARAEAEACFDAYKTCAASAGTDATAATACRTTLKSCLPARAPAAGACGADGGTDADDDSDEAADEAADKDDDRDESAEEAARPDGGVRVRRTHGDGGVGHGDGRKGGGKKGGHGERCGRPDVPADRLGACTTASDANLSSGMGTTQTAHAHRQCVQKAFSDRLSDLCERANKVCEASDAVPAVCTQIAQACTTVNNP